jgi:hypothetical protein
MTRQIVGVLLLVLLVGVAGDRAWAQSVETPVDDVRVAAVSDGRLRGTVVDEEGEPLSGVVVSAMGMATAFQVTDEMGQFMFRDLPLGAYLVRAHLKGYVPVRAREVQVIATGRAVSNFELILHQAETASPVVLAAGMGLVDAGVERGDAPEVTTSKNKERAWRLRHLRRSILKEASPGTELAGNRDPAFGDIWSGFGRAVVGTPVRLATALFSDPVVSAEFNFLTSTSFSRPQDLFSGSVGLPRGVAYVALEVPDADAVWSVQGAMTQGDLASWILAGSYASGTKGAHQFKVGMSYSMQRYAGGNTDALTSMRDGSRNSGVVYGSDRWSLGSSAEFEYGARFAVYDYLTSARGLLSPHASLTVSPIGGDSFQVRASISQDSVAPGAAEFLPPSSGLLLPPERTFSAALAGSGFAPELVRNVEVGVQREMPGTFVVGVRAFRQSVANQIVTLFGSQSTGPEAAIGHYYVGSAGDFDARGVGLSVRRSLPVGLTGAVEYTVTDATWLRRTDSGPALALALSRPDEERMHDITTLVEGEVPSTSTRVFLIYKLNSVLALPDAQAGSRTGRRFDFRVNQALPFLDFTSAEWEILVSVRNIFHDAVTDMSVFDEVLVVRSPKQIVGGLTVRF